MLKAFITIVLVVLFNWALGHVWSDEVEVWVIGLMHFCLTYTVIAIGDELVGRKP